MDQHVTGDMFPRPMFPTDSDSGFESESALLVWRISSESAYGCVTVNDRLAQHFDHVYGTY